MRSCGRAPRLAGVSSRDDGARDERAERAQAEEQAWREIVEHYDDLPAVPLDGLDGPLAPGVPGAVETEGAPEGAVASPAAPAGPVGPVDAGADPPEPPRRPVSGPEPVPDVFRLEPYDEQFVPPPLPPAPEISTDRRLAWVGLVAPPVLLLIVVVLDYPLPSILTGALVLGFLASFGYLVATMSTEPRDPDDDGARL
jgi:hypothetical protein